MSATITRKVGDSTVPAIGLGLMSLSGLYNTSLSTDEEKFAFLDAALAKGCTFWDSADLYGDSEDVLGRWFKKSGKRNEIFLATKFGCYLNENGLAVNASPEYAKTAFQKSLDRLGVDQVDLYYLHRADTNVPIEHTVAAMAEFVKSGKVKYLGLSEVSAATLRRAHAVHPITAVQIEYSAFVLDIEHESIGLLKTCRELGVKVVAYSPLGRGLLSGHIRTWDDLKDNFGFRQNIPKFSKENFPAIVKTIDDIKAVANRHNATPGQVALAWLLAQGDDILVIPGTNKIKYLEENIKAGELRLSSEEIQEIRKVAELADNIPGDRYPPGMSISTFADTPAL